MPLGELIKCPNQGEDESERDFDGLGPPASHVVSHRHLGCNCRLCCEIEHPKLGQQQNRSQSHRKRTKAHE